MVWHLTPGHGFNRGDAERTERALRAGEFSNHLTVAGSGADALAHGFDLLAAVKADPRLRRIPVVVMTSSHTKADVVRSYDLHASGYVTKPFDPADVARAVLGAEHYWHSIVRLPSP